ASGRLTTSNATANAGFNIGAGVTNSNGLSSNSGNGFLFPDVVGNLRVDQAWGSAQIMGAMHDASGAYYAGASNTNGHPNNAVGWEVGCAIATHLPSFGATSNVNSQPTVDQFQVQASYGVGASAYVMAGTNSSTIFNGNNHVGVGWLVDGVYGVLGGAGTQVE